MPSDETRLLERLLADGAFRRRFEDDPAAVAREAGFAGLADELARDDERAGVSLEIRESRSSIAGVLMAVALEGLGLLHFASSGSAIDDSPSVSRDPAASPLPGKPEPAAAPEPDPGASTESADVAARAVAPTISIPAQIEADRAAPAEQVASSSNPDSHHDSPDESSDAGTGVADSQDDSQDDGGAGSKDSSGDNSDSDAVPRGSAPDDDSTGPVEQPTSGPTEQPGDLPPELPVDPDADAAAQHLAEFHYGFVRDSAIDPNYTLLRAAGYNGILFHANDPDLGEAIASARAAGMPSVGVWAPANLEDPETYARRLADLDQYKPDIVVPDVEIEGKGYPGSPQWKFSETFASLYRKLVPHQTWAVTVMAYQDDFNYAAYTTRGAQVWPQTYGATYETTFDPKSVVERVEANRVDPRLINPVLAPNQSGDGLGHYASYALDDFQEKYPLFVPRGD